jgi:hypothetical protein
MGEENTGNTEQNPQEIIPPSSTAEYVEEPINDSPNPTTETGNSGNKNKEPINVIVNIPQEDKKPQITANRIQVGGIIVSIFLGVLTYILLLKTIEANKISKDSLIVAQQALADAREIDSINRINDKKREIIDSFQRVKNHERDKITLIQNQKSLETQMDAFSSAQKQFKISNKPFIQAVDVKVDSLQSRKPKLTFTLLNMGKYPAKVTAGGNQFFFAGDIPVSTIHKNITFKEVKMSNELVDNILLPTGTFSKEVIPNEICEGYMRGELFIYLCGRYQYINDITMEKFVYTFIYRIGTHPESIHYVENENTPIK